MSRFGAICVQAMRIHVVAGYDGLRIVWADRLDIKVWDQVLFAVQVGVGGTILQLTHIDFATRKGDAIEWTGVVPVVGCLLSSSVSGPG